MSREDELDATPGEDADEAALAPAEARRLARLRARALAVRDGARRADGDHRLLGVVRAARRRLPGDDRFGDPLSTAADRPVDLIARGVSGLAPKQRPSAANELGLGALQLWQALSERTGRGRGEAPASVLFTDLVGFSSWALGVGDDVAVELLREVGDVVERAVAAERGRVVKRLGDGVMAVFPRPDPAAEAALAMLDALAEVRVAGHTPRLRAGIHHGHPRLLGGDLLGVDVNIAARVGEAAGGGALLASEPTAELLDGERFALGRPRRLRAAGTPAGLAVRAVSRRRS